MDGFFKDYKIYSDEFHLFVMGKLNFIKCSICNEIKHNSYFITDNRYEQGKTNKCKSCYYNKYKESIKNSNSKYYKSQKYKYWSVNNKNKKTYSKTYYEANKDKINARIKQRRKKDPLFKLRRNTSSLIGHSIKNKGYTKKSKTYQILGCTYKEFKEHIERQFTKGMTWDNQGEWHLDHIYPVSLAENEEELIKLNHYTNFQPLWAEDNLKKSNKIENGKQIKLL